MSGLALSIDSLRGCSDPLCRLLLDDGSWMGIAGPRGRVSGVIRLAAKGLRVRAGNPPT